MSIRRSGGLSLIPAVVLCAVMAWPAAAVAQEPSRASTVVNTRYLVEVDDAGGSDIENTAGNVVAIVGGRLEPYASMDVKAFVLVMSPSKLPILRGLPHVKSVTELVSAAKSAAAAPPLIAAQSEASPRSRVVAPAAGSWSSGTYAYDAAGDIRAIGADIYVYDTAGRLVSGTADKERSGIEHRQDYSYDGFGNRTSTTTASALKCVGGTDCAANPGVDSQTNRVSGYEYDDAGNVVQAGTGYTYTYDGTGSMVKETFLGGSWQFVYTADGTRLATYGGGSWHWTVRNANGTVLREFTSTDAQGSYGTANWIWIKDYVYRGTRLLAAESSGGRWHFHLDHLGTPRLITGDAGETIAYHSYYPFGAELELFPRENVEEHLKFTGHERDTIPGDIHTLDYMRARYASPFLGSFLSVDPVGGDPAHPQSWNRYAYVRNNPILLADFTGMDPDQKGGCNKGTVGECASIAAGQLDKPEPPPEPELDFRPAPWRQQGEIAVAEIKQSVSVRGEITVGPFVGQLEVNAGGDITATMRQSVAEGLQAGGQVRSNDVQGQARVGPIAGFSLTVNSANQFEIAGPAGAVRSDGLVTINFIRAGQAEGASGRSGTVAARVNIVQFLDGFARGVNGLAHSLPAMRWVDYLTTGKVRIDDYILDGGPP